MAREQSELARLIDVRNEASIAAVCLRLMCMASSRRSMWHGDRFAVCEEVHGDASSEVVSWSS